ncbi:MAG: hypothetical protein V3T56_09485, partial [Gemmatimonadales bacterium]
WEAGAPWGVLLRVLGLRVSSRKARLVVISIGAVVRQGGVVVVAYRAVGNQIPEPAADRKVCRRNEFPPWRWG